MPMRSRPLTQVREGYVETLSEEEAASNFAPSVLKVAAWTNGAASAADKLHELRQRLVASPNEFPILIRTLFCDEGDDRADVLGLDLPASLDLSLTKKLQHLPWLLRGLLALTNICTGAAAAIDPSTVSSVDETDVGDLIERNMEPEEAAAFEAAWEACRYGQRFECQAVEDLGALKALRVKDLMAMQEADGESLALVLLRNLVDAHNAHVELLDGGNGAMVEIYLHQAKPEIVSQYLVPWYKARMWLESNICALQAHLCGPKELESLVHAWLTQTGSLQLVRFSMEGWPRLQQVPACVVRLPPHQQTPALPHEFAEAIEEYFKQYGLLRDKVLLALEALKKIAMAINANIGRISPETPLSEKVSTLLPCIPPGVPGKVLNGRCDNAHESPPDLVHFLAQQKAGKLSLRIKHLNALQDYLSERIDSRVEEALTPAYRTPIDDDKFRHGCTALHQEQLSCLIRKLSILAEILARQKYHPFHGMVEHGYLAEIEIECHAPAGDDDPNLDSALENLRLEHTFHALTELRMLHAAHS